MQRASLLDAAQYHAGQFADLALRILFHHLLHAFRTSLSVTFVQQAETLDEEELRTVLTQREAVLRELCVRLDLQEAVGLKGIVGGSIQRVLDMHAKALVLHKVWVGEQDGPLAFGEVGLEHGQTAVRLGGASLP